MNFTDRIHIRKRIAEFIDIHLIHHYDGNRNMVAYYDCTVSKR